MPSTATPPQHWWQGAIIYEIYPRSFQDSNGDGVGDLRGITSRLDYLRGGPQSLGVDAIWVTPIYPSPLYDFGYDVSDYTAIDPIYGTIDDFERLSAEAHKRDIKVVMDLVANHTSHEHAWFKESRADRENPRRDWYIWRDPAPDGGPPNNWTAAFGGSAWEFDEATGQYYLHSFLPEQPDLNWRNREVREAIYDVVCFWVERGVDGFRLDAIDHIAKDETFADNPPNPIPPGPGDTGYNTQLHIHDKSHVDIHEWLQGMRAAACRGGREIFFVSEIYDLEPERIPLFHGGAGAPEMDMSFNFDFLRSPWDASAFRNSVETFNGNLPPGVWPNVVLNNHDQPRVASRYDQDGLGEARARVAAVMLLTLHGTVFLYYGEEIGMKDGTIPRDRLQDPVGVRHWPENPGRDPERTPMQWSADPGAGFTDAELWLPVGPDLERLNVASEERDTSSTLSLYRHLISLRRESPALLYGTYASIDAGDPDTYWYVREAGNQGILVGLNFVNEGRERDLSHCAPRGTVIGGTHGRAGEAVDLRHARLAPNEAIVIELAAE